MNNATNAFRQTCLYPSDPNCKSWSTAIETLGLANDDKKGTVPYEVYPLHLLRQLSEEERNILHLDLKIKASNDITGDVGVAILLAEHIMSNMKDMQTHSYLRQKQMLRRLLLLPWSLYGRSTMMI